MNIHTPRTCDALGVYQGRPGPGCTCTHDTDTLPRTSKAQGKPAAGGYYFAPGAIEQGPRRRAVRLTPWQRLVLGAMAVLLASGLLGFAAGVLHAKGWPL